MPIDSYKSYITALPSSWKKVPLQNIGTIHAGDTPSRSVPEFWGGDIPWATPGELTDLKYKIVNKTDESITDAGLSNSSANLLPIGTLLLTTRATIGNVAIAGISLSTNQGFKNIILFDNADIDFYYHLIQFISPEFIRRASGTTYLEISGSELAKVLVPIPPLREQRRIAEILDSADEAIRATERVIDKLKQVKKGLLHDLLTRGLDENGQLRNPEAHPEQFKESALGRLPKEWAVTSINELAINHDRRRIPLRQSDRDLRDGKYPYYGASGVIDWIDDYIFDGEFVLLGEDGANVLTRELPLAFIVKGKFWANNHAHIYEPHADVNIRFLRELLEWKDYTPIVRGSAQPKITQNALKHLSFRKPSRKEQNRIASVLETHDDRIHTEEAKLAKLKQVKRGLMDDLLTGRVRV